MLGFVHLRVSNCDDLQERKKKREMNSNKERANEEINRHTKLRFISNHIIVKFGTIVDFSKNRRFEGYFDVRR